MIRFTALFSLLALPALAETPRVVVDIAPVHALMSQVMDGVGTPELLLQQDANPHAIQLRPSQARMLADADVIVWVGPDLSPWLDRAIDGLGGADQIVLLDHPATTLSEFTAPRPAAEHADHDDGHDHHEEAPHDHAHGDIDPHAWLSADNARAWVGAFADELSLRDPENADAYRANAARADARLADLIGQIEAHLAPHAGAEIITFHEAFGYFADQFGIEIAGSIRPGDAATPSAGALAEIEDLVRAHGVECGFAEPGFDPGLLEAVAGETGLRIGTLDPIGVLQAPGATHYAATMRAIADGIAGCLEDG